MKVFGEGGAFSSTIVQGLDWAVTRRSRRRHQRVLRRREPCPTRRATSSSASTTRPSPRASTVSQGSGDAGATSSPSPPATDDNVIDAAASTNFRAYAQTHVLRLQVRHGNTYLSDNISSIGGGGFGQDAQSVDVVAPGEADWALCTPNPAIYTECPDFKAEPGKGAPASLQQFGGTSQATPLTAGTAALVIEAYRNTHGGRTPAPALVKQLIMSTANDLGLPARRGGLGRGRRAQGRAGGDVGRPRPTDRPQPADRAGQGHADRRRRLAGRRRP